MLIKRTSWNGKKIYQCQSEKSGYAGVGLYKKYLDDKDRVVDILTPFYRRKNIVLLKKLKDLKKVLQASGKPIDEDRKYPISIPGKLGVFIESIKNQYQSKGDSNYEVVFKEEITMERLIFLMLNGFHIDEMKVGRNETEKRSVEDKVSKYFKNDEGFLSINEAKKKLEDDISVLDKIKKDDLTKSQEEEKKFLKKWLECLSSIQNDNKTLKYKRGNVGLKIERDH